MAPADPAGRRGVPAGGWSLGAEPGLVVTASREPWAQVRGQRCEEGSTTVVCTCSPGTVDEKSWTWGQQRLLAGPADGQGG